MTDLLGMTVKLSCKNAQVPHVLMGSVWTLWQLTSATVSPGFLEITAKSTLMNVNHHLVQKILFVWMRMAGLFVFVLQDMKGCTATLTQMTAVLSTHAAMEDHVMIW